MFTTANDQKKTAALKSCGHFRSAPLCRDNAKSFSSSLIYNIYMHVTVTFRSELGTTY